MPTAKRFFRAGHHYHLTHRCHNRSFLLKFAKDRNAYREMLRQCLRRHTTPLLGYCITSNHVHLLVTARDTTSISRLMDALEGDFAQYYNIRKNRTGAFWGGRYHATAVDSCEYLWECLLYIELNMVRAGVVNHPAEWRWSSYGELIHPPKRYRLIDRHHFQVSVGQDPDSDEFRKNYEAAVQRRLDGGELEREPGWTEGLVVGRAEYVAAWAETIENRRQLETVSYEQGPRKIWVLKEAGPNYA